MIFLGDIACPDERLNVFIKWSANDKSFENEIVVLNLEANIVDKVYERKNLTLYNCSSIAKVFPQAKKVIVSMANNHMYDYPDKILATKHYLESQGIGCFGLYQNEEIVPYEYEDKGISYAFFGHCWCLYTKTNKNKQNDVRVVDCPYEEFLDVVSNYIRKHKETRVYCFMHWNYDLESLPFPMERILSKKLIDAGVAGVIGGHSHRPQGMELYKGKPIAYCMGNFYLPSGIFFNGKLKYPECSMKTYAVRINSENIDTIWYETDVSKDIPLKLIGVEDFSFGKNNRKYSSFVNMNKEEYETYFVKHRLKNKLVPKFKEPYGSSYRINERFAIIRVKLIRKMKGLLKR